MMRRYILLAAAVASIWGFGSSASARCTVNLDTCVEGDCIVNAGDCNNDGACAVNLPGATCGEGEACDVNFGASCDDNPLLVLDTVICPVLVAAPEIGAGLVALDKEGDIRVAGSKFWDCPPYDAE